MKFFNLMFAFDFFPPSLLDDKAGSVVKQTILSLEASGQSPSNLEYWTSSDQDKLRIK